jgi:hypothetical protein
VVNPRVDGQFGALTVYMRKAGVSIKGITDVLDFHDPEVREANVINLNFGGTERE